MIAVSSSGASFRGLASYLRLGKSLDDPGRVDWTADRNLPTDDIALAGKVMRETAAQNRRVRDPLYHLVLSFDPRDAVTREEMERVVDRVLVALKLDEHQALLVAHRDRAHAHVHVMVNRIHPETHRAWNRWHDMVVIQEVLRSEERAHGWRSVPGRLSSPDLSTGRPERTGPEGRAFADQHGMAPTEGSSLVERARAQLADWRAALSWSDLATRLDAVGLWVEGRVRGAVVTDGEHYIRASRVAPDCSGPSLAARFGEPLPAAPDPQSEVAQRVQPALARYGSVVEADRAVYEAEAWAAAARHRRDVLEAARERADESWQVFGRALARVCPDVGHAGRVRAAFMRSPGNGETVPALDEAIRLVEAGARSTPGTRQFVSRVLGHEREALHAAVAGAVDVGARALAAERDFERLSLEIRGSRLQGEHGRAGVAGAPAPVGLPDPARDRDLREAFAGLYASPDRAIDRFKAIEAARGGQYAIRVLFTDPEQLGRVRAGTERSGPGGSAHAHAVALAHSYLAGSGRSPSELAVARSEVAEAERAVTAGLARQRAAPERAEARSALRGVLKKMTALELAGVRALLTVPERALVRTVRQMTREVALGRSDVER